MGVCQGLQLCILLLIFSCRSRNQQLHRVQLTYEVQGVCSTWGMNNFRTFDGNIYSFPGTCNYIFASHVSVTYSEFDIQIRRTIIDSENIFSFEARIGGVNLEGKESALTLDGQQVWQSTAKGGIIIEDIFTHFIIRTPIGLTLVWNKADDLQVSLPESYKGSTHGLCGNFDGNKYNDFEWEGFNVSEILFGNLQRLNGPGEECNDVPEDGQTEIPAENCQQERELCESTLQSFGDCENLVPIAEFNKTCTHDLCISKILHRKYLETLCGTLDQYTRECVRAGGDPGRWRKPGLCNKNCSYNMEFMDRGNPCHDTCSNPKISQLCKEPVSEGCFCPPGTLLDDIHNKGCIPADQCPCRHNGKVYATGQAYSSPCQNCTCDGGQWSCTEKPCSGKCSFTGGSHVVTFDETAYTFHGDCKYLLSKHIDRSYIIIGQIEQCGTSRTVTCMKSIHITTRTMVIKVCYCGAVYINKAVQTMPYIQENVTITKPSTSFVQVALTALEVHVLIQIQPTFQVFITVTSSFKGKTAGLCGNFNSVSLDDFQTVSGVVENSASAFANSWKTMSFCPDVYGSFEDPCLEGSDKGKYAELWCQLLINTTGAFAPCHQIVEPTSYYKNCLYDTCNSVKSEEALCAALSTYAKECSEKDVKIFGWRTGICEMSCHESMVFSYSLSACNSTCRFLAQPNAFCDLPGPPVEGCGCPQGAFLNENLDQCVEAMKCPCFYNNEVIPVESSINIGIVTCKCIGGVLECPGQLRANIVEECPAPMYYLECLLAGPDVVGSECQKSCKTQDMDCYNEECISGCVCPDGLVSDDHGGCIPEVECPCVYGESFYNSGHVLSILCNTCTCINRTWSCTNNSCPMNCNVYGNGHFRSFDGTRFDFTSECDYILTQDFCVNNPESGTFSITIKNIACGMGEAICSVSVSLILQNTVIVLTEGVVKERIKDPQIKDIYQVNLLGMYIIVKTLHGLTLMWDQKTTVIVQLAAEFQGKVCGMCGNFDRMVSNDFKSRYQSLETSELAFGNSWQVDSFCPGSTILDPCSNNPFRQAWAQKQCSIIKSPMFASCHAKVNPVQYFEACVTDTCSCNSGGDCQCLCTAIAAYSSTCREVGICINWRSPEVCPVFCDFYNHDGHCMWHYKPCGDPCLRTCRNPQGKCDKHTNHLEGCYPHCSTENPYYDDQLKCVSALNCTSCQLSEKLCTEDLKDCLCCYNGRTFKLHEEVYNITDGVSCTNGICGLDGNIIYASVPCSTVPTNFPSGTRNATISISTETTTMTSSTYTTLVVTSKTSATEHIDSEVPITTFVRPASSLKITMMTSATTSTQAETSGSSAGVQITTFVSPAIYLKTTMVTSATTSTQAETSGSSAAVKKQRIPGASVLRRVPIKKSNATTTLPPLYEFEASTIEQTSTGTQPATNCYIVNHQEIVEHNNCTSTYMISVPFCEGQCGTSSMYSHEAGAMRHKCFCCLETETRSAEVDLLCLDGSSLKYSYVYVEECSCTETQCQAFQPTLP
ncbi:mucin-5B-like [Lissotriton helveticus]